MRVNDNNESWKVFFLNHMVNTHLHRFYITNQLTRLRQTLYVILLLYHYILVFCT